MLTPWWKPTLSNNNNSIRIDKGLNFIPSKVGPSGAILPAMQWKREFCFSPKGKVIKLGKKTTYFWVKCTMEHNNHDKDPAGYLVADKLVHQNNDDGTWQDGDEVVVDGSIRNYYLVSKARDQEFLGVGNYDIVAKGIPTQPDDTRFVKHQYLGSITKGAFGIKHWEWRLNHVFYWNHMCAPVGSFGDTSKEYVGSVPGEGNVTFLPGDVT